MLNIYLARHGQDEDNVKGILNGRRDHGLTDQGVQQAKCVADKIADAKIRFDVIYCSPLKRTFKTAQIITETNNSPDPIVMEELIERDFGIMTGRNRSEILDLCAPKVLQSEDINYFLEPEGAETFPQLLERGRRVVKEIRDKHDQGNILLVTHGDMGKMIYAAFYDLDWQDVLLGFHFGNADLLLLSEESLANEAHVFKISSSYASEHK